MNPGEVSAVVVTRGDVDLNEIIQSLRPVGFREIVVWSNTAPFPGDPLTGDNERLIASSVDLAVFGRYAAIDRCRSDYVFVQDDDCLVDAAAILHECDKYDPTSTIVANMPASRWSDYPDSCLVGWGAAFHRDLPTAAFSRIYGVAIPSFHRECDVVFTTLTPHVKIDVGFTHLPWAEDPERAMFLRPWRQAERDAMYALAREVRDAG